MKKLLVFAFCSAALLTVLSCNNKKNKDTDEFPRFDDLPAASEASAFEFEGLLIDSDAMSDLGSDSDKELVASKCNVEVTLIEFTEAKDVIMEVVIPSEALAEGKIKDNDRIDSKGNLHRVFTGTFESAGDQKTIKTDSGREWATLEVTSTKATTKTVAFKFALKGKEALTGSAKVTVNPASGTVATNLCRKFKIERTDVEVTGGDLKADVGYWWNGCNFDEIAVYLKKQGVKISDDITGYNVKYVEFTGNNTLIVKFSGQEPFKAKYTLSGTKFNYNLDALYKGNSFINASGNGSVDFFKEKGVVKGLVVFNAKITNGSLTYNATVELTVLPY